MSQYLLDTNAISAIVRDGRGRIAKRARHEPVCTSIICVAELRFGAARRPLGQLTESLDGLLGSLTIHPFDRPAERCYGDVRADLERRGELIGAIDIFIAAHALALNMTLVTDNVREFERVSGLRVENWLRD